MSSYFLRKCLCCGSSELKMILDLGNQPPANSYSRFPNEHIEEFPLGLNICKNCWHAQLSYCVDRHFIFDYYSYVSGTSSTLNRFFVWFSASLAKCLPQGSKILELAANDGSLVKELLAHGIEATGIDPAKNIVDKANANGLPIRCGYWPEVANDIEGKFDAIICMNVLAHVDNPRNFLAACKNKLRSGGLLLIQPSQARMFGNCEFDTCYHEHISFFNTCSMSVLAKSAGLRLYETALVRIHGDSPIFVLGLPEAPPLTRQFISAFSEGEFAIDEHLADYEKKINLFDWSTYDRFRGKANNIIDSLRQIVDNHRRDNFEIVFVGAAAKSMTVINAGAIKPDRFLDESFLKIGLYAPGVGIKIESLDVCKELTQPALFVITAWNFRHELTNKLRTLGVPKGSKFYSYFPVPEYL